MLSHFIELTNHMFWADAEVWNAGAKFKSGDESEELTERLLHLHMVQHAYLCLWQKQSLDHLEKVAFNSWREISDWGLDFHRRCKTFLESREDTSLNRTVDIPWTDHLQDVIGKQPEPANLAQTLNQVILHSTYHRGQINTAIRKLGGEPPMTDFIFWIWTGKPESDLP